MNHGENHVNLTNYLNYVPTTWHNLIYTLKSI